jgi:hypothetical protein
VMTIVKTLLNNLLTHIGHEDDGHLVHWHAVRQRQGVA